MEISNHWLDSLSDSHKTVLVVLFIPSVQRDGITQVDQEYWVEEACSFFGLEYGGATAYPKARGIWRDDENDGVLVEDEPVILHCYTTHDDINDPESFARLKQFCRRMGRETHQGEVGLVIKDHYIPIRNFSEE